MIRSFIVSICSYVKQRRTSRGQLFQFLRYLLLKWDEPPPASSCGCVCILEVFPVSQASCLLWLSPSTIWGKIHVQALLCVPDPWWRIQACLKSLMWLIRILGPGSGLLGHSVVQSRCNLHPHHWLSTACWWVALPRCLTLCRWGTLYFRWLKFICKCMYASWVWMCDIRYLRKYPCLGSV